MCITIDVAQAGPYATDICQSAQAEFARPVTEVCAPGTEVIIGDGTAESSIAQGTRINAGLVDIFRENGHQLSTCCISSAITHSARLSFMSLSIPFTARVRLRLPCAERPDNPPFCRFSCRRLKTVHRSFCSSCQRRGARICVSVTG